MSLPWKLAPGVPSVGTSMARASMPASRACCERLADGRHLRVGEGDARRADALRHGLDLAPEQVLRRDPGLVLADVGEERPAVDVADRVEPLATADAQPVVGLEEAVLAGLDAGRVEVEVARCGARVRPRSGSPLPRPGCRRSSSAMTPAPPASILSACDAGAHVDAEVLAQRVGHLLAGEGLLAREQVLVALDQGDLGPKRRPGLGRARCRPGRRRARSCSRGPAWRWFAWRLFQASTASSPSIGGIAAPLPVATITAGARGQHVVADDAAGARRRSGRRRGRGRSRVLPARAAGPSRRGRG